MKERNCENCKWFVCSNRFSKTEAKTLCCRANGKRIEIKSLSCAKTCTEFKAK